MSKKNATSDGTSANVARMVAIGAPSAAAPETGNLAYLDNNVKTAKPLNDNPQLTEGNPDPATLKATVVPEGSDPNVAPTPVDNAPAEESDPDGVDDARFRGKGRKDIYQAYKNLESEKGRMANELGDIRKTFDFLVQQDGARKAQQQAPVADPEADAKILNQMLTKPAEFIQTIKQQTMQELTNAALQNQMKAVQAQHANTLNDPGFRQWLVDNVPQNMAKAADTDPATFDFIMRQYNAVRTPPTHPSKANTNQRVVQVPTTTGPVNKPPAEGTKIWSRREIQYMIANDRPKYEALLPEITRAYNEGRVQ